MKIPDRVDVVVVVGVDAAQNGVCLYDHPLYTAVTVALAQGVHGFVDVLQLLALFLVGKKPNCIAQSAGHRSAPRTPMPRRGFGHE